MTAGAVGGVLRGYFENYGGVCYLANTAGRTLKETLAAVEAFDDVTILVPLGPWDQGADAAGEQARAVAAYTAGHHAMAILHADRDHNAPQARDAANTFKLDADQSAHTALYHPWLIPTGNGAEPVPPVGVVAGAWAHNDSTRGLGKAPAGRVDKVARLALKVSDKEVGEARSVNFLREIQGQGTQIRGARTLDDPAGTWRYISVRRLADAVERDLQKALRAVASEPNSRPTWDREGGSAALQGNQKPAAYFVMIGQNTMSKEDAKAGRLILKVGIAPTSPADFIVVTVTGTAGKA
ncbi:phage tail sheath family protein [Streptomyces sp. NPDC056501]|uniref:phage tail sheath family protein n=1 Tax=Streptomyces sp. NPDC056501 TaxID=3345841 RepID=UPI0036AF6BC6